MIIESNQPTFWDIIRKFSSETPYFSALYSQSATKYYERLTRDAGFQVEDHSIIILNNGTPAIVFFITTESDGRCRFLRYYGIPSAIFYNREELSKKIISTLKNYLAGIQELPHHKLLFRDYMSHGELNPISNFLLNTGATADLVFTHQIDLTLTVAMIKRQIRKSYSSLISWAEREIKITVLNSKNIKKIHIEEFRELHFQQAQQRTRSEQSWITQYQAVKADEAFILFGHYKDHLVSAGFFFTNKSTCYYGVSASDRTQFDKPLFHGLMWQSILYAKNLGCRWFDLGDQYFSGVNIVSTKEVTISKFKRGFGGETKINLNIQTKSGDSMVNDKL